MCYLLCGTRLFQQSMRNTLTNVLIYMQADMEITTAAKGSMLAAIATGYFFTQVPGGALADKLGSKNVMTLALFLSAICCILVPTAGDHFGLSGMWVVMALMGAVQGPMFPTSSVFLSKWMPKPAPGEPDEKAWGTSMLDIGISIGSLLIIPTVTTLADALGWRNAFRCVGFASLGFVALWVFLAASSPQECWFISQEERTFLDERLSKPAAKSQKAAITAAGGAAASTWIGMPYGVALHSGLWAVYGCHMAFNFGAYYLTNWSPTYYKDVLGMSPHEAKYHLMLPHVTNLVAKTLTPALIALLARQGFSLLASRKAFTVSGYLAASLSLAVVHSTRGMNPWVPTALFSMANAFFGLAPSGFKSNYLDITEEYVGVIAGYGNTLGTVSSVIGPKITAWTLIQTDQNWNIVLGTVCFVNLLAAFNYSRCAVVTPLEQLVGEGKAE